MPHQRDGIVIVFAPFAKDAESVVSVLVQQGVRAEAVRDLSALAIRLGDDVGAVLMTEEALAQQNWRPLIEAVNSQPSWSAYPFILLISQRRSFGQAEAVYSTLPQEITNVMVLERPTGIATLTSAVRWALSGRRRQFLTRNHLLELERNANQQRLMTRELAHRVKNTIAVLQSIVTQTMRPYPDQAHIRDTIVERFAALGRAHDLLLGKDFAAADFEELVTRALSVHPGSINVKGPPLELSPQASLSFALVLHELATNSAKYGALRAPNGHVRVEWSVRTHQAEDDAFSFEWTEQGGPPVPKPTRIGFGTRLVKSTLSGWGDVIMNYRPEGFHLGFQGPLQKLTYAVVPDFDVPVSTNFA